LRETVQKGALPKTLEKPVKKVVLAYFIYTTHSAWEAISKSYIQKRNRNGSPIKVSTIASGGSPLEVISQFYLHDFIGPLIEQEVIGGLVEKGSQFSGQEQVVAEPPAGLQKQEPGGTV